MLFTMLIHPACPPTQLTVTPGDCRKARKE